MEHHTIALPLWSAPSEAQLRSTFYRSLVRLPRNNIRSAMYACWHNTRLRLGTGARATAFRFMT